MQLTRKQRDILNIVIEGNISENYGRYCEVDVDQILDRIDYTTSKESLQFSLRSLIAKGMVTKNGRECRRGRARQTYAPTELTLKIFKSQPEDILE